MIEINTLPLILCVIGIISSIVGIILSKKAIKVIRELEAWYISTYGKGFAEQKPDRVCTGSRNVVLGKDAKLIPAGICTNSDILPEEEKRNDPFNPINRCIFCSDGVHCYFAGECENRKPLEVEDDE